MGQLDGNIIMSTTNYSLTRLDSNSDCSTNRDDSVRSAGYAMEMIGKDIGSPFVLIRTHSRDDDGHIRRTGAPSVI